MYIHTYIRADISRHNGTGYDACIHTHIYIHTRTRKDMQARKYLQGKSCLQGMLCRNFLPAPCMFLLHVYTCMSLFTYACMYTAACFECYIRYSP